MHSVQVIAGGLMLLGIFLAFARAFDGLDHVTRGRFILAFIPVWLACALFDLWIGVARAGYPLSDELAAFVAVFGVPAALAYWLRRRVGLQARGLQD